MSRIDEPTDDASRFEVANRVLDHHAAGGDCQACRPDDCPQTQWALAEVARAYARWDSAGRR